MSLTANLSALPEPLIDALDLEEVVDEVPGVDGKLMARRMWAGYDLYEVYRSGTRWDVGGWTGVARLPQLPTFFLPPRMWLGLTTRGLLLTAWLAHFRTPNPFKRLVAWASISHATYNHQIGQLCLTVRDGDPVPGLRLDPLDAFQILANIDAAQSGAGSSPHTKENNA
jgi:hypothetical protein